MFCIAFFVRTYIGAPIVAFLAPRIIGNKTPGFGRGLATTTLNVCVTSPITAGAVALLFTETDNFLKTYLTALSTTIPLSIFASYFIIGPVAKMLFNNLISPASGLRMLRNLEQNAPSILRILGM